MPQRPRRRVVANEPRNHVVPYELRSRVVPNELRCRVLPNELIDDIFERATFTPNELDLACATLGAAKLRLTPREAAEPDLQVRVAIRTHGSISCLTRMYSEVWEPLLYRTIVISSGTQLRQVLYALTRNKTRHAHIQRIDINWTSVTRVRDLLALTPNLRHLSIIGPGQGNYRYTLPELEYVRIAARVDVYPQVINSQNIRILDLSRICFEPDALVFQNVPLLPHLHTVGVRLGHWLSFVQLWRANGAGIQTLFVYWSVRQDDQEDLEDVGDLWLTLLSVAIKPTLCLPNLTHFITSLFPPFDCSLAFPHLQEMEILHYYEVNKFQGINPLPHRWCFWGWLERPKIVKLANIPQKYEFTSGHKDMTDPFWRYHQDLKDFIGIHIRLYSMTETDGPAMIFQGADGKQISYTTLQHFWRKHLGNDLVAVQDPGK